MSATKTAMDAAAKAKQAADADFRAVATTARKTDSEAQKNLRAADVKRAKARQDFRIARQQHLAEHRPPAD